MRRPDGAFCIEVVTYTPCNVLGPAGPRPGEKASPTRSAPSEDGEQQQPPNHGHKFNTTTHQLKQNSPVESGAGEQRRGIACPREARDRPSPLSNSISQKLQHCVCYPGVRRLREKVLEEDNSSSRYSRQLPRYLCSPPPHTVPASPVATASS